jgi:hypothetical protein
MGMLSTFGKTDDVIRANDRWMARSGQMVDARWLVRFSKDRRLLAPEMTRTVHGAT